MKIFSGNFTFGSTIFSIIALLFLSAFVFASIQMYNKYLAEDDESTMWQCVEWDYVGLSYYKDICNSYTQSHKEFNKPRDGLVNATCILGIEQKQTQNLNFRYSKNDYAIINYTTFNCTKYLHAKIPSLRVNINAYN